MKRLFSWFENLVDPYPPEPPVKAPDSLWRFCRHYTKGLEPYLLVMTGLTALSAVGEALLYAVLGQLVDWLAQHDPKEFVQQQWPLLLGFSLFVLLGMPFLIGSNSLLLHQTIMGNFPMKVRWQAHRYLLNQSYAFFQQDFSGRIATKLMQTALAVRDSVVTVLNVLVFISVYLLTTLFLVMSSDWRLSAPILVWLALYTVCLRYFLPRLSNISMLQADARSTMTGRIVDSYANILTLKLFSHADRESKYVKDSMEDFMSTVHPQMRLVTWLEFAVGYMNMTLIFSVGVLGLYLWIYAAISPGAIAIAMAIAIRLTGMSHWIMWEISRLFENVGTVQDGLNTLSVDQHVRDDANAQELTVHSGDIQFNSVHFNYNPSKTDEAVFDEFNLHIKAGEKVGVVGRSGAGKSTLVNLLMRFYDIQGGEILIDEQNIKLALQRSLRSNIAMVSQDTSLLHRSVRDNIMFGRPEATEQEMIDAAGKAQALEFIAQLRDSGGRTGFDAHVGERGVTLSGGQRQRIAIARVLLKNAPILVLDEATSALDSEIEVAIQECLHELMQGKTVIAIAHRLSTIAAMDRLIVLDEGQIVEQGDHQTLLNEGGVYSMLWAHQSGGFLTEPEADTEANPNAVKPHD